jgi:hypothetical protein
VTRKCYETAPVLFAGWQKCEWKAGKKNGQQRLLTVLLACFFKALAYDFGVAVGVGVIAGVGV